MGLGISHGAFSGSYRQFNHFRKIVGQCYFCHFPPHEAPHLDNSLVYCPDENDPVPVPPRAIVDFLSHSDCDGEIPPEECDKLADAIQAKLGEIDYLGGMSGNFPPHWNFRQTALSFIIGCRKAHAANQPLRFY